MIRQAKDLSRDQKKAIESLQHSWESAKRFGMDKLTMEEIDAEIVAAQKAWRVGEFAHM
jgi:hypothetical protein